MIDFSKQCFCDNCSEVDSSVNPSKICFTLVLGRTKKKIALCSDCLKQITEAGMRRCEVEGINLEPWKDY